MIIHDLDLVSVPPLPLKTDTPLVVDTNAILSLTLPGESLKTIARRNTQIVKPLCSIQYREFPPCHAVQTWRESS